MTRLFARSILSLSAIAIIASPANATAIIQTGSYPLNLIYDAHLPGVGPVCVVTPGATAGALAGNNVVTYGLPFGPASAPRFTLPSSIGGNSFVFPGGFASSTSNYILTGQTSFSPNSAGEVYLTPAAGGPTSTLAVNGNYDATARNGSFYVSATHGSDSHGDAPSSVGGFYNSGIYAVERSGGTLTGLDLLFDTGTYSGAVAADSVSGDLYFALGGTSSTIAGGANDVWVLKAADVAAASGAGVISSLHADYVGTVGTPGSDYVTGMDFDPSGSLLVGITEFGGPLSDRIYRYGINRSNALDYVGSLSGTVAEASDTNARILDFALDGNTLIVTAVPEPATLALLALGLASFRARRHTKSLIHA